MLHIKNKGATKTFIHSNGKNKVSKINWDADYDGKNGVVSLEISDNKKKKHVDVEFDNNDLAHIFNIPSENKSLEERLLRDFSMGTTRNRPQISNPMVIEIVPQETNYDSFDDDDDFFTQPISFTPNRSNISNRTSSFPLEQLVQLSLPRKTRRRRHIYRTKISKRRPKYRRYRRHKTYKIRKSPRSSLGLKKTKRNTLRL
jgi:hypothetical protein